MKEALQLAPRRMMVVRYIAAHPGASSREIAAGLGAIDEGQLSKLLRRARELGYARSEQDGSSGAHAWLLTEEGRRLIASG